MKRNYDYNTLFVTNITSGTSTLQLRKSANNLALNTALAHLNTEVTILTPVLVPAVGNLPVLNTILNTPTNKLDSMSAKSGSSHMLVDTTLVGHEVLIHSESNLHRSVGHELSLDGLNSTHRVSLLEEVLIILIGHGVSLLALSDTLRSILSLSARRILTSAVMLALSKSIGIAPILRTILSSSGYTHSVEPVPSRRGETSLASESAYITASKKILRRQTILDLSLRSNAQTISSSLSSSESPARTAHRLITNLLQRGALRPLLSSIEGLRKIFTNSNVLNRKVSPSKAPRYWV